MITNAQVKIHTVGNVSLGSTTAPPSGFKLQLIGNSVFSANNGSITSSAYIRGLNAYSTAITPDYTWWGSDQTGIFHPSNSVIGFSSYGQERMRITPGGIQINSSGNWAGSIFVNATTPNATGYGMRYRGSDNFYVHASGWIYSQGQYIGSDKKFKKNIKKIPNSLDKVKQLRGVNYELNYSDSLSIFNTDDQYMGVVAQEVEEVVPEVVKTLPDGTKAVAYQNLVGLLIEAIKEQQVQIEVLQNEMIDCCKSNKKN